MFPFVVLGVVSDSHHEIILDPAIRDWVLLPIFLVMFLQGVLRQYVSVLLRDEKKVALDAIHRNQLLKRSQRLRFHSCYLAPSSFRMRKRFLLNKGFLEDVEGNGPNPSENKDGAPELPQQDPLAMVGMMKQNMAMILPNMIMMGWVSYFFSGFVLVKLPFGLTDRFKSMLQRGVMLNSLDVSYVSSLSWYFINLFGLRGLFSIVLGSETAAMDNTEMMAQQMQGGMGQVPDPSKIFDAEKTELEIVQHEFAVPAAEQRLLALSTAAN